MFIYLSLYVHLPVWNIHHWGIGHIDDRHLDLTRGEGSSSNWCVHIEDRDIENGDEDLSRKAVIGLALVVEVSGCPDHL